VADVSEEQGRGQKIFQGVHVTKSKLKGVAKIFRYPDTTSIEDLASSFESRVIQLEVDALIVDKNFIALLEVKNTDNAKNGREAAVQLERDALILKKVCDILSVKSTPPIKKLIHFSCRDQKTPTFSISDPGVTILRDYIDKEGNPSNAKELLKDIYASDEAAGAISDPDRKRLIAALTFLRFSTVSYQVTKFVNSVK